MSDAIEDLYRLKRLRDEGGISDEQYEAQREATLTRAARKGTAKVRGGGGSTLVVMLTLLAIVASVGALALTIHYRHAPPAQAPVPSVHRIVQNPALRGSLPYGMSSWDGTQSMSEAGTQDMTPPGVVPVPAPPASAQTPPPQQDATQEQAVAQSASAPLPTPVEAAAPPPSPVQPEPQASSEVRVTAGDLSQAFQTNSQAAMGRLAGRRIVVSGIVQRAILDVPDDPSIDLEGADPQHSVGVNLERNMTERASHLNQGDRITLTCQSVTDLAGIPVLDRCSF